MEITKEEAKVLIKDLEFGCGEHCSGISERCAHACGDTYPIYKKLKDFVEGE